MTKMTFIQDTKLPAHGRRTKAQNAGTVRVHVHRGGALYIPMNPDAFDIFLNVNLNAKVYHATVEAEYQTGPWHEIKKHVFDVEVPSDILEELIRLAQDKDFISLKNNDIFPGILALDGRDVEISVQTDSSRCSLRSNMLEDTIDSGVLPTTNGFFQTPFDRLATIGFKTLGIKHEVEENEEN